MEKVKLRKSVMVYISSQNEQLIIAPQYRGKMPFTIEQQKCFAYEFPIDYSKLGNELRNCLNLFYYIDEEIKIDKKTEWPAYEISKCKTKKSFGKEYIFISIRSANESNMILGIEGSPYPDSILSVTSAVPFPFSQNGDELAKRVLLVYEACKNKYFD